MRRNRYLICYDIHDDRRLRRIAKVMQAYGYRLQYSVFECALDKTRLEKLKTELEVVVKHDEDQILIINLGEKASEESLRIQSIGLAYHKSPRIVIV